MTEIAFSMFKVHAAVGNGVFNTGWPHSARATVKHPRQSIRGADPDSERLRRGGNIQPQFDRLRRAAAISSASKNEQTRG